MADSDPVTIAFHHGCKLKDQARTSRERLELYEQASEHFRTAGELSMELAQSPGTDEQTRLQAQLFAHYYLYEEQECLSTVYYERHDIAEAERCHKTGIAHLRTAIDLAENALLVVSQDCADHLRRSVRVWKYYLHVNDIELLAIKARDAWDSGDLHRALDHYRLILSKSQGLIEDASDPELDPAYRRIAIGNVFGMQVNASQALASVFLSHASEDDILPADVGLMLLEELFRAYQSGVSAYRANPEWDHYRTDSGHVLEIIKDFLDANKDKWQSIFIAFEENPAFLALMKEIDMERFKEVESKRHIRESKAVKLWQYGGFWLLAFGVIFAAVYLLLTRFDAWWQVLSAIIGLEVLLLLVGALTLRTVGDLSETNFLALVRLALQQQFRMFSLARGLFSRQPERDNGEKASGSDKPMPPTE